MGSQYGQKTVGTSAVAIASTTADVDYGIDIQAHPDNTGRIYVAVGLPGDVSASGDDPALVAATGANGGWILTAGKETSIGAAFLPDRGLKDVYILGSAGGQIVCWRSR